MPGRVERLLLKPSDSQSVPREDKAGMVKSSENGQRGMFPLCLPVDGETAGNDDDPRDLHRQVEEGSDCRD